MISMEGKWNFQWGLNGQEHSCEMEHMGLRNPCLAEKHKFLLKKYYKFYT